MALYFEVSFAKFFNVICTYNTFYVTHTILKDRPTCMQFDCTYAIGAGRQTRETD